MNSYSHAASAVSPAILLLLCLAYAYGSSAKPRWRQLIFWISVLVASLAIFVFVSIAPSIFFAEEAPSLKATLISKGAGRALHSLWIGSLFVGAGALLGCLFHWIRKRTHR
jgi:hypothetical protein